MPRLERFVRRRNRRTGAGGQLSATFRRHHDHVGPGRGGRRRERTDGGDPTGGPRGRDGRERDRRYRFPVAVTVEHRDGRASSLGSSLGSTLQTTANGAAALGSDVVGGATQAVAAAPGVPSGASNTTTPVGTTVSGTVNSTVNKAASATGKLLGGSIERAGSLPGCVRATVTSFDLWVDRRVQSWRGRPLIDAVSQGASAVGDHGLAWFVIGLRPGPTTGPESYGHLVGTVHRSGDTAFEQCLEIVGGARSGPIEAVHRSGPSGSPVPPAFPRAIPWRRGVRPPCWRKATRFCPAFYGLAVAISYSRVHVRLHHASDVLGGMVLGIALGRSVAACGPGRNR